MIFLLFQLTYFLQNRYAHSKENRAFFYTSNHNTGHKTNVKLDCPSPSEVTKTLLGMQSELPEGTYWTDASSGLYKWHGGTGTHGEIAAYGTGCAAFAFRLSDEAFGTLPARLRYYGDFHFSDVRPGDILRVEHGTHSVIVVEVYDEVVVLAEGNYCKTVHWGRIISKEEVELADYHITRYPEGYVPPDDPSAREEVASGKFGTNNALSWKLLGSGQLTISGQGACPDFDSTGLTTFDTPWANYAEKIISVVISPGVTSVGANAFRCINMYSISIPETVRTIGDYAFQQCSKLTMVSIPEGCEVIGESAFAKCVALTGVTIPSTIKEVKAGAFSLNQELATVKFLPSDHIVEMGDSLFSGCYALNDVTLPPLIDKISAQMFQNCISFNYLFVPNRVTLIGEEAFQKSGLLIISIPNTVTEFGFNAFFSTLELDLYFCGTSEEWGKIYKGNFDAIKQMKPRVSINYVTDITEIKVLNPQSTDITAQTTKMEVGDTTTFSIDMKYSSTEGLTVLDPRYVEWFLVTTDTQPNDISAIESATNPNIVDFTIVKDHTAKTASLQITALQNGNVRIAGHIQKNPSSSTIVNEDHIFAYFDIKVGVEIEPNILLCSDAECNIVTDGQYSEYIIRVNVAQNSHPDITVKPATGTESNQVTIKLVDSLGTYSVIPNNEIKFNVHFENYLDLIVDNPSSHEGVSFIDCYDFTNCKKVSFIHQEAVNENNPIQSNTNFSFDGESNVDFGVPVLYQSCTVAQSGNYETPNVQTEELNVPALIESTHAQLKITNSIKMDSSSVTLRNCKLNDNIDVYLSKSQDKWPSVSLDQTPFSPRAIYIDLNMFLESLKRLTKDDDIDYHVLINGLSSESNCDSILPKTQLRNAGNYNLKCSEDKLSLLVEKNSEITSGITKAPTSKPTESADQEKPTSQATDKIVTEDPSHQAGTTSIYDDELNSTGERKNLSIGAIVGIVVGVVVVIAVIIGIVVLYLVKLRKSRYERSSDGEDKIKEIENSKASQPIE